ncbi:MAG: hypothetical protein ACKN9W_02690 [Methylococcus sp.]
MSTGVGKTYTASAVTQDLHQRMNVLMDDTSVHEVRAIQPGWSETLSA